MPAKKRAQFKVLTGMDYFSADTLKHVRREPGDIVDDLPPDDIRWLTEDGHIERVKETTPAAEDDA